MTEAERYHLGQYEEPYESTIALAKFIRSQIIGSSLIGRVLDVGCGAGASIHWFDEWGVTKDCQVIGIDTDAQLLAIAKQRNPSREFQRASFLNALPPCESALSIQTLSFIEDWRPALRELLAATKGWLFISSLFWDGVETHTHASDGEKVNAHYNVIDLRAFAKACTRYGGEVVARRQHFPKAVMTAPEGQLRSRMLAGFVFSGPLYMPWSFVAVRKT